MYHHYKRYYSTNTKHFYNRKNHIIYTKYVKSLIYIIIFSFIWCIIHNLFLIKHKKVTINFIQLNIDCVLDTSGCCQTIMRQKTNYSTGEILSTKYYHHFIIEIEFSWVLQIQLGIWGALQPTDGGRRGWNFLNIKWVILEKFQTVIN